MKPLPDPRPRGERRVLPTFLVHLAGVFALVVATYNPEGPSFAHVVREGPSAFTPASAFAGVVLTIGWVYVLRGAWRGFGVVGTGLALALLATGLWWALDATHASLGARTVTWLALLGIALVFSAAMTRGRST